MNGALWDFPIHIVMSTYIAIKVLFKQLYCYDLTGAALCCILNNLSLRKYPDHLFLHASHHLHYIFLIGCSLYYYVVTCFILMTNLCLESTWLGRNIATAAWFYFAYVHLANNFPSFPFKFVCVFSSAIWF